MADHRAAARDRLRGLVTARLGIAPSAMPDARVDLTLDRLPEGLDQLASRALDTPPWQTVIEALLIGETSFFRQTTWFAQLEQSVLKPLIDQRTLRGPKRLRLWSAGCSTGEEAYTLAMIVDRLLGSRSGWEIAIVGTDINLQALEAARGATYRSWSLREVDAAARLRHFRALDDKRSELAAGVREPVAFRSFNLAQPRWPDDPHLSAFDLIVCRNVLMYLTQERQQSVARALVGRLAPGGWLAVAPAEAVAEWFRPLTPLNVPSAILFHQVDADAAATDVRPSAPPAKRSAAAPVASDAIARIRALAAGYTDGE